MRVLTRPVHYISFAEQIQCFCICSSDFAVNLVCVATEKKITLGQIRFPEESDEFDWECLKVFYHENRCHAVAFAPETSLVSIPKNVIFCAAGADFLLRIFRTDVQNSELVQTLKGHSSYINDIAWQHDGNYLASVSDDYTCKIWSVESNFESVTTFCLSSAGISVKWHPEEPQKVLVAEKRGVVHFYNVRSQQAIISVETAKMPLMSADWSLNNRFHVSALARDLVSWDLRRPCTPITVKQVHEDGGHTVQYSPNNELILASIGRPEITLKVFNAKSTVPLIEATLKLFGGMAWHPRLPYIGAASDRNLCFWKIPIK